MAKHIPINNNVLVEITREYAGVSRTDSESEAKNKGTLLDFSISPFHLTASAGIELMPDYIDKLSDRLSELVGKTVRWEEFAEGGQTFEEDGKTYAFIPWWRLIGAEIESTNEESSDGASS